MVNNHYLFLLAWKRPTLLTRTPVKNPLTIFFVQKYDQNVLLDFLSGCCILIFEQVYKVIKCYVRLCKFKNPDFLLLFWLKRLSKIKLQKQI